MEKESKKAKLKFLTSLPQKGILIFASASLLILSVIMTIDYSDFWHYLVLISISLIPLTIIIWIFIKLNYLQTKLHFLLIILLVTINVSFVVSPYILEKQKESTITTANQIIYKLESYKKTNGFYPKKIEESLPHQNMKIPETTIGIFKKRDFSILMERKTLH